MAERLTYLPSAGFSIAVAAVMGRCAGRRSSWWGSSRWSPWGIRSTVRAAEWRSDLTLWESEIAKAPRDVVVNNNLAVAYSARGDYARAISPLEAAIRIAPGYWRAHVNLGVAEQGLGRPERRAPPTGRPSNRSPRGGSALLLRQVPGGPGLLRGRRRDAGRRAPHRPGAGQAGHRLGLSFLKLGRADEARAAFQAAVAIDPADAAAKAGLAGLAEPAP